MGLLFAKLFSWFSNEEHKVIIVGLDNAGKTTILYQFLMSEVVHTSPTIGSNVEEVRIGSMSVAEISEQLNLTSIKDHGWHIQGSMSVAEISEQLNLTSIKDHGWHIQACCALTGEGLYQGLEWITNHIRK
ncbi:ADP-ribosylation factor-like protein 5B [Orbicella faveolata]|uniref:ADP-ribosylation factor-like protein 5B n=1 Tax=Orbicella faveolata TaxID=48498 RepID=UPI0009E65668|nr:ADP-ribosylation factor-like protein 5B [Orbicella faveolata]